MFLCFSSSVPKRFTSYCDRCFQIIQSLRTQKSSQVGFILVKVLDVLTTSTKFSFFLSFFLLTSYGWSSADQILSRKLAWSLPFDYQWPMAPHLVGEPTLTLILPWHSRRSQTSEGKQLIWTSGSSFPISSVWPWTAVISCWSKDIWTPFGCSTLSLALTFCLSFFLTLSASLTLSLFLALFFDPSN